jgi:hypothetical protein
MVPEQHQWQPLPEEPASPLSASEKSPAVVDLYIYGIYMGTVSDSNNVFLSLYDG